MSARVRLPTFKKVLLGEIQMGETSKETIDNRLKSVEEKINKRQSGSFFTAFLLALLPVCFGLYQFYLSNEFKREDTQTRGLLAALEGETPSEICGNLSLLVEGGLVTGERLSATKDLIAKITKRDGEELDGGLDEFDCLPRIVSSSSDVIPQRVAETDISLANRIRADDECAFDQVELQYTSTHDQSVVSEIEGYLEAAGVAFTDTAVTASTDEEKAYSGLIWYYYPEARRCAQSILVGLKARGVEMNLQYYTRKGLPSNLPIRIWPNL